ncbi:heavy-metal-associated domain-containing protein [Nesterenkonia massiliensis]|uniref:Heavy-metal-associated domain-containing protein n=1 Tax=Nesterenkonia massiliensis TaxID=1232429 RepID=A0ABT2HTB1_9MICC|nr:heavy-metal-associated domain-containing protein [Nesterenkonia massiliensis]MCT1607926.1 heavy-metal-associated domain-containing protein [Nesterenkonia massiliensis]
MKAAARLGLYGLALVAVFGVSVFTANAIIPEDTVQSWAEDTADNTHHREEEMNSGGHEGHEAGTALLGLGLAQDGYQLTSVSAPTRPSDEGELTFAITGPDGNPVTDFERDHEEEMHLVAVRADGQRFAHVHPERDETGIWSIPWQWESAGTYRIFADFVPAETGEGLTLSTMLQVAGSYEPVPVQPTLATTVEGFDVAVSGDLVAGSASELTMTVTRDGESVTTLEPYLGAFGHLVALRDGDLAYLHVHPHGDAPAAGETSGPEIVFEATAPTPGRYLLYLDFQVDGQVHTAPLVIDTTGSSESQPSPGDGTGEHEEGEDHDH